MTRAPALVWFRQDLRLADHPALAAATAAGGPVVPVFIWAPAAEGAWPIGAASRWWLHHSLERLAEALERIGSRLVIRAGDPATELVALARETGATAVHASRRWEPAAVATEERVVEALAARGVAVGLHGGALLHDPRAIRTQGGAAYKVFTPFWRAVTANLVVDDPLPAPRALAPPAAWPDSTRVDDLGLLPTKAWDGGLRAAWTPGEAGARARLARFVAGSLRGYAKGRDTPAEAGTSALSPHLHWGETTPRQVWRALRGADRSGGAAADIAKFEAELGWREFAHHVLANFPRTEHAPLRPEFAAFPCRRDPAHLRAWQRGRTGYPLVDAGMRELWATGWMHNRVRMVVASFLVKHLLLDWREGARWFWETLVDADLASNTLGWQWVAGCGADAAPYFRIFNPVSQGERFDARGAYIRRWVPELARLDDRAIHAPWMAPPLALHAAGVELGRDYPRPIVDHPEARARALAALEAVTGGRAPGPA
jgi:deoxyribodipyrimidine photo-lyase